MTVSIKHTTLFNGSIPDDPRAFINPSDWDAGHALTQASAGLVGASASGASRVLDSAEARGLMGLDGRYVQKVNGVGPDTLGNVVVAGGSGTPTFIDVRDYAAELDGVTDDAAALNAAISAAVAQNIGVVFVPGGTALIGSAINMQAGVELRGDGRATIKRKSATAMYVMVECGTAHGCRITNLYFDGNRAANAVSMDDTIIHVRNANDVRIDRCSVTNSPGFGVAISHAVRTRITRCDISDNYMHGVFTAGAGEGHHQILDNYFTRNSRGGVMLGQASYSHFRGNILFGHLIGGGGTLNVSVSGNVVTWVSGTNFASVVPGYILVINAGAEYVVTAKNSNTELVIDTSIATMTNVPASIGSGDCVGIGASSDCVISGNYIGYAVSFGVVTSIGGSALSSSNNLISGNVIESTGKTGVIIGYDSGSGAVVGNAVIGNRLLSCGCGGGNTTDLDLSAIGIYSGTPGKVIWTTIDGNAVSSASGAGQTKYWLAMDNAVSPASIALGSNSAFNVANGNDIANDVNGSVIVPPGVAGKNLLMNSAFLVNQRAFAGGAASSGAYTVDRWKADGSSNLTFANEGVTITSGGLEQVVEPSAVGVTSLASRTVTLSIDSPTVAATVSIGSQSGTIAAGSGRKSFTATLGAGETGNISVKIKPVSGTLVTYRPKLELGGMATPWEPQRIEDELASCRRYCTVIGRSVRYFMPGFYNDAGQFSFIVQFDQAMRAAPTVAFIGTLGTDYGVIYGGTAQSGFTISTQNVGPQGLVVVALKAAHGLPVGSPNANFFCFANGGILLTAEL